MKAPPRNDAADKACSLLTDVVTKAGEELGGCQLIGLVFRKEGQGHNGCLASDL